MEEEELQIVYLAQIYTFCTSLEATRLRIVLFPVGHLAAGEGVE